jgi:hypothetical protein
MSYLEEKFSVVAGDGDGYYTNNDVGLNDVRTLVVGIDTVGADKIEALGSADGSDWQLLTSEDSLAYIDGYTSPQTFDVTRYKDAKLYVTNIDADGNVFIFGYQDKP